MFRKFLYSMVLIGFLVIASGCTQAMDKELFNMRTEAAANERLYGAATLKFADGADQMASMKHELQKNLLAERTSTWIKEHTVNGVVTASPQEMTTMFTQRDAAQAQLAKSIEVWTQTVSDFRRMINDKMAFSAQIFAKEADAQRAREEQLTAGDSLLKAVIGAGVSAATFIPLAF